MIHWVTDSLNRFHLLIFPHDSFQAPVVKHVCSLKLLILFTLFLHHTSSFLACSVWPYCSRDFSTRFLSFPWTWMSRFEFFPFATFPLHAIQGVVLIFRHGSFLLTSSCRTCKAPVFYFSVPFFFFPHVIYLLIHFPTRFLDFCMQIVGLFIY